MPLTPTSPETKAIQGPPVDQAINVVHILSTNIMTPPDKPPSVLLTVAFGYNDTNGKFVLVGKPVPKTYKGTSVTDAMASIVPDGSTLADAIKNGAYDLAKTGTKPQVPAGPVS